MIDNLLTIYHNKYQIVFQTFELSNVVYKKYFCLEYDDKYYYFNNKMCDLISHCFDDIEFDEVEKYITEDYDEYFIKF